MGEQARVIAEVLEGCGAVWSCVFHLKWRVGEHDYDIAIERKKNRLELTAALPVRIDADRRSYWSRRVRAANEAVEGGRFALCDDGRGVLYRVYSLCASEGEIKDAAAVKALLDCCREALARQGEALLARDERRSVRGWLMDLLPFEPNGDGDAEE